MSDTAKLTQRQINALAAINTGLVFPAIENGRCTPEDVKTLQDGGYVTEARHTDGYALTDKRRAAWKKAIGAK